MMADSPELRRQFEQKLASDPQFAADRAGSAEVVVRPIEIHAGR